MSVWADLAEWLPAAGVGGAAGAALVAFFRSRPELKKIESDSDASLRGDLFRRIDKLEEEIKEVRRDAQQEIVQVRQEAKREGDDFRGKVSRLESTVWLLMSEVQRLDPASLILARAQLEMGVTGDVREGIQKLMSRTANEVRHGGSDA